MTADEVILHTKSVFARHGIPEEVISDNGPQFSSKLFQLFSHEYGSIISRAALCTLKAMGRQSVQSKPSKHC